MWVRLGDSARYAGGVGLGGVGPSRAKVVGPCGQVDLLGGMEDGGRVVGVGSLVHVDVGDRSVGDYLEEHVGMLC